MHSNGRDTKVHIKNERFYSGNDKYNAERTINKHIGNRITAEDAQLIREYIAERQAVQHISENRARKLATSLTGMRRFIVVPYDVMTTEDVITGIAACKKGHAEKFKRLAGGKMKSYDAGPLSPNSIMDFIKITKQFISWLNEAKRGRDDQINEKRLKGVTRGIEGAGKTPYRPEDLLTLAEVNAMILAANTIRDKAFISVLFESHARGGEIGRMTWADLDFSNADYVEGQVWDSKGKGYRYPTFVDSRDLLISLRNNYRNGQPEGDSFVFVEDYGEPISLIAEQKILIRAAERAIETCPTLANKPYWKTHNMRHSAATISLNDGMRVEDLCQLMWGKSYSPHVETYVQRSKKQIHQAQLKAKGVKEIEKEPELVPWRCPKCKTLNGKDVRYCAKCGRGRDEAAAKSLEEANAAAEKSPHYKAAMNMATIALDPEFKALQDEFNAKLIAAQEAKNKQMQQS